MDLNKFTDIDVKIEAGNIRYTVHDTTVGDIYYEVVLKHPGNSIHLDASLNKISKISSSEFIFSGYCRTAKAKFLPTSFVDTEEYGIIFIYYVVSPGIVLAKTNDRWKTLKEDDINGNYIDLSKEEMMCMNNKNCYMIKSGINNYKISGVKTNIISFDKKIKVVHNKKESINGIDEFMSNFSLFNINSLPVSNVPDIESTISL